MLKALNCVVHLCQGLQAWQLFIKPVVSLLVFDVDWGTSRPVLLTVAKVPELERVHILQLCISACSQQPGPVHVEGILLHLKIIRAHSEKHRLNHVRLVLPVGRFV